VSRRGAHGVGGLRRLLAVVLGAVLLAACDGRADAPGPSPDATAAPQTPTAGAPSPAGTAAGTPSPEPTGEEDDGWVELAPAPTPLTEVAAAPFGGSVWTAGGLDASGEAVALVQIYDPRFDGWEMGPALPEAVHHAALVATGDAVYLIGGYLGSSFDEPSAQVHVLDAATGEWGPGPALPEPRAAGAAAWDGTQIVYAGGVGPDGVAGDVVVLDGDGWSPLGQLSEPREHLAAASDGAGRVWFLGGRTGGLDANLGAVDLVADGGVRRIGDLPTPRGGVAGLHLGGVGACALGGEAPHGTFDEVECVDADGSVTSLPPLGQGRHGLGAAVTEGAAYAVLGGAEPGLHVTATIEALTAD
jgi:hypothetical protein